MAQTFEEYYRQLAAQRNQAPAQSSAPDLSNAPRLKDGKVDKPQSPLNWFIDIISRPLFGATSAVGGIIEGSAQAKETGNPLSALGGVAAAPTNFLAGLFSTDDSSESRTKMTYGDLMEQSVDRLGPLFNDQYQDVQDNVNPVAKGVGGLTLDIVADPLTWIPGGLILKGAKGIGTIAKGAAEGAEKAIEGGIRGGKEAIEAGRVPKAIEAAKVERTADGAIPMPAARRAADESPSPVATTRADLDDAPTTPATVEAPVVGTAVTDALKWARESTDSAIMKRVKLYESALSKKQTNAIAKHEASLVKAYESAVKRTEGIDLETTAKAVAGADTAGERTLREMIDTSDMTPTMREEFKTILESVGKAGTKPTVLTKPQWATKNADTKLHATGGKAENTLSGRTVQQLRNIMRSPEFPVATKNQAKALMDRAYEKYAKKAGAPTREVTDALMAWEVRKSGERDKLVAAIGEELFDYMERKAARIANPKLADKRPSFERSMDRVLKMLDPETDLVKFFNANKGLAEATRASLGIPTHVKPTPNTVSSIKAVETALSTPGGRLEPVAQVFVKTLGEETPIGSAFRKKYPYGRGDAAFTDKDKKIRVGNLWRHLNSYFQWTLMKNLRAVIDQRLLDDTGRTAAELKKRGRAWAVHYGEAIENIGGDLVEVIQTFGTKLHIGVGDDLLPITFPEVYKGVRAGFEDDTLALLALYNGGSSVAPTVLFQAVHHALNADDLLKLGDKGALALHQELVDIIMNPKKYGVRGGLGGAESKMPNNISKTLGSKPGQARGFHSMKGRAGSWTQMPKGKLAEELATAILRSQEALKTQVAVNAKTWAERGVAEAAELTNKQIKTLQGLVESGAWKSDIARQIDNMPKGIADDATEIGATQNAVGAATEVTAKIVGDENVEHAKILMDMEQGLKQGKPRKPVVEEGSQKIADDAGRSADEFDPPDVADQTTVVDDGVPFIDLSEPAVPLAQQTGVAKFLSTFRETFDARHGVERTWDLLHRKQTVARKYLDDKLQQVKELNKFTPEVQLAAVKSVQNGVRNANPEIAKAQETVYAIMRDFWRVTDDVADGRMIDHVFLGVEPNVDHMNAILGLKGLPDDFVITGDNAAELVDSWRAWEFKNPAEELVKLSDAAATVAEHRSIVGNFVYNFRKEGLIKDAYEPGFVKVVSTGKSTFGGLLPEGIFVEKNLAQELHRLDKLVVADRQMKGEIGVFLSKYFIPAQGIWKSLVTVWRLGHHIRNTVSNAMMQWVGLGNRFYVQSQRDALKLMGLRNDGSVDVIDSLRRIGDKPARGGDNMITGRFTFTADELINLASDRGLLTSFTMSEDLFLDAARTSALAKAGARLHGSKLGQVTGGVSQFIDHYGKLAFMMQALRQASAGKGMYRGMSREKTIDAIIRDVKRSHPDAGMLTPKESKYRWIIPFYTWFAKTMPYALESAIRNPARIAIFPKASYNLAVAMGVNPDSLIDPFPSDQLFPSYVTEGFWGPQFVGPDGQYININPGIQHFDLFREIGVDPVRGIAGMTTPLVRAPLELLSGGTWGSGARINDPSDYVDQQLPVVNYIANLTGVSPSGSIPSVLSGQGLDPQLQISRGNKGEFDQGLSALNWLFGMNAQNWSRPNFINYAEIEKRNRAAEGK